MSSTPPRQPGWTGSAALLTAAACLLMASALAASKPAGAAAAAAAAASPRSSEAASARACARCGTVMVTVAGTPGDFISYVVGLDSLRLTRADGMVVEMIPAATQVDFAGLPNLSKVIDTDRIPAGRYVSAAITLDYSAATIVVNDGSTGVTIAPSHVIDGATGEPLAAPNPTRLTRALSPGRDHPLIVSAHAVTDLALSLDLPASHAIAPSNSSPISVTVKPVLIANLTPDASGQIQVRGALVSVGARSGSYVIDLPPGNSGAAGSPLTIDANDGTIYMIDGTGYVGTGGLAQLASVAAGTMTAAYGSWDSSTHSFTASSVQVGPGVAFPLDF